MAKFCTTCGRQLEEGEVCNCSPVVATGTATSAVANQTVDTIVDGTKSAAKEILPILKNPIESINRIAQSAENMKISVTYIVAKCLLTIICFLVAVAKIKSELGGYADFIEIPYFKIILLIAIFTAGWDFLEGFLLQVFAKIFGYAKQFGTMLTVVGGRVVFDILSILLFVVLALISGKVAIGVALFMAMNVTIVEYAGFKKVTAMEESKSVYVYAIVKAIMFVVTCIVLSLMAEELLNTLSNYIGMLF